LIYQRQSRHKEACQQFELAAQVNVDLPLLRESWSLSLVQLRCWKEAVPLIELIIQQQQQAQQQQQQQDLPRNNQSEERDTTADQQRQKSSTITTSGRPSKFVSNLLSDLADDMSPEQWKRLLCICYIN
jgi:hypothetical protein